MQPRISQPQRKKERRTIFGCICPQTGQLVTQVSERGNTKTFFSFLVKALKSFSGKKLYVVLDNVRYHHAKRLKPLLEKYKSKIELVFLPPYSPDLNPIERVWWLMRKTITHNRWVKTMEQRIVDFENWSNHTPIDSFRRVCRLAEGVY